MAEVPGWLGAQTLAPMPPEQPEWIVTARWANKEDMERFGESAPYQRFEAEGANLRDGQATVQFFEGEVAAAVDRTVTSLLYWTVPEAAGKDFAGWHEKYAQAMSQARGFQRYQLQEPIEGLQSDWVEVVRWENVFDRVLFVDATHINVAALRRRWSAPARLLLISFPAMLVLGYVAGWALFPSLGVFVLAALATIVAPTDAALGQAVISNPKVPLGVRQTLSVESGLNDGLALPVLLSILAVAQAERETDPGGVLVEELVKEVGLVVLAGLAVGLLAAAAVWSAIRIALPLNGVSVSVASLGALAAAAGTAQALGGSIMISAFVAGLVIAPRTQSFGHEASTLPEEVVMVLTLLAFVVFGGGILSAQFGSLTWQIALYATLSLAVIRPLATAIAAIGSGAALRTIAFIGWFGPRGLASILFVALVARKTPEFEEFDTILSIMTWSVAASVVAHGVSAWPGSNAYARWASDHSELIEDGPEHRRLPEGTLRPRAPELEVPEPEVPETDGR